MEKGYSKFHGLDYNETYAPIARMDSIRLVFSIATSKKWEVHHMDVKSSFLHVDMEEEICMRHLERHTKYFSFVYKLRKYTYGLKQALRAW